MAGAITRYLEKDHERIDDALRRADSGETIDLDAYAAFRGALLRHIGMEEKILLPAAQAARGGEPLPATARLHLDHGALAALLVRTPTKAIIVALRAILNRHNPIEEGPEGVYEQCEQLEGVDKEAILARLKATPPVTMNPYADSEIAIDSMRAALQRAGYSFDL